MKRTLSVLALVLVLPLSGCAQIKGTVVGREAEAGEFERDCKRKKQPDGTYKQVCKTKWDDPDWSLQVRDADGKVHEVEVDEGDYNRYPDGSAYPG